VKEDALAWKKLEKGPENPGITYAADVEGGKIYLIQTYSSDNLAMTSCFVPSHCSKCGERKVK